MSQTFVFSRWPCADRNLTFIRLWKYARRCAIKRVVMGRIGRS